MFKKMRVLGACSGRDALPNWLKSGTVLYVCDASPAVYICHGQKSFGDVASENCKNVF